MTELNFANLMDLATVDTSDMNAQTSRLPVQGIYIINLNELKFAEQAPQDPADPMNYRLNVKGSILALEPLLPEDAPKVERLLGTDLREGMWLSGEDLKTAIQLIMGRFKTVGFKHKGIMGGVEGGVPGWIDEALDKRVAVRVRHYTNRTSGQEQAAIDWMSPKQMKAANLEWEVMDRDFLDENGVAQNLAA